MSVEGFTGAIGEPLFLWLFDTADNMAIDTIWQNLGLLPKGLVLPNCMGFARLFKVSLKGLRNLSMTMNIADRRGVDIIIKGMETYEKV